MSSKADAKVKAFKFPGRNREQWPVLAILPDGTRALPLPQYRNLVGSQIKPSEESPGRLVRLPYEYGIRATLCLDLQAITRMNEGIRDPNVRKHADRVLAWATRLQVADVLGEEIGGDLEGVEVIEEEGGSLPVAAAPTPKTPVELPKWDGKGSPFDAIREFDEHGREFWEDRRLQTPAGYSKWQHFEMLVDRAEIACRNSGQRVEDHFTETRKMIPTGKGAFREVRSRRLSRYACYLVFMNGDPNKPEIAAAQQYFAIRTHQAEEQERRSSGEGVGPDALAMMAKAITLLTDRSLAIEDATKAVSLDVKRARRAVRKARQEADNAIKAAQSAQFDAQVAKEKQEEYERIANVRMAKIQEEAELARQMASKTARTTVYDFDRELGGNVARANRSALADIGLILTDQYRRMQEENDRLPSLGKTYSAWCDDYINEYPRDLLLRNQMLFADYLNQANHITTVASHIRSVRAKERSLRGNRRQSRQRRLF